MSNVNTPKINPFIQNKAQNKNIFIWYSIYNNIFDTWWNSYDINKICKAKGTSNWIIFDSSCFDNWCGKSLQKLRTSVVINFIKKKDGYDFISWGNSSISADDDNRNFLSQKIIHRCHNQLPHAGLGTSLFYFVKSALSSFRWSSPSRVLSPKSQISLASF